MSHAAHVFKNGIENNPQYASNYRDLGLVYQNQERYADALGQFNKALTLEPGDSGTLFNIAITHAESGNTEKALVFLGRYLQRRGSEEDPLRVRTAERLEAKLKAQQSSRKKR